MALMCVALCGYSISWYRTGLSVPFVRPLLWRLCSLWEQGYLVGSARPVWVYGELECLTK